MFSGKARGRIGKRAEQVIRHAARELGYRPNSVAQTLRLGRSKRLVLAVPDIENPYFAGTLKGAEREARRRGYSAALAAVQMPEDWQTVIVTALSSGAVDGFALFALRPPAKVLPALRGKAVFVDCFRRGFPCVKLDIEEGTRAALRHLLSQGHTRIGHLAADVDAETFSLRKSAYLETIREAGLSPRADCQAAAPFDVEGAAIAVRRILSCRVRPTALVCDSDVLAAGVYKAARALRLRIPEDLSVVGIDDSLIARILDPPLTTVAIDAVQVGEQGVRLLADLLQGCEGSPLCSIPLRLVVRESTAPARPNHSLPTKPKDI